MSADGDGARPEGGGRSRGTALVMLVTVLLLTVIVVVGLVVTSDGDRRTSPAGDTTATTSEEPSGSAETSPTPPPAGETGSVQDLPPALPPVGFEEKVTVAGVTVTVEAIEAIQGEGTGPGNVAGPALRVTVQLTNGTADEVSLDGVSVNLAYGPEHNPASPLDDSSRRPFAGSLAPGGSADGVYVFSVPRDDRESVTIEVGHRAGVSRVHFSGPAA